jgi:hypothetical protein
MAKPKLALIPSGYSDGKVFSVLPANGDGDFTFSRGSNATRVNKDGLIETVTGNTPRLDYTDSSCPSLLLEPQRTNLLQYSEDFSDTYWSKARALVTANQFISPDGSQTADKYRLNCTSNRSQISRIIYSVGTQYTTSLFVKYDSVKYFYISNAGASAYRIVFDIENGTIVSTGSSVDASKIENYGNGWYRCSATFTAAYTTLYYKLSPNSNSATFTNTTDFSYIWGGQIEEGSYPTSYIPTNGAAATRLADVCDDAGNEDTFNDSEGVLMAEISALANDGTNRRISISDGSTNNRIVFSYSSTNNQFQSFLANPSVQFNFYHTLNNSTEINKIALKYKLNDFALWINGVEVATDNSGTLPIGMNRIAFDEGSGAAPFYGNTKQVQYYNTALTGSELEELTSWESFIQMANGQNYTIK